VTAGWGRDIPPIGAQVEPGQATEANAIADGDSGAGVQEENMPAASARQRYDRFGQPPVPPLEFTEGFIAPVAGIDIQHDEA